MIAALVSSAVSDVGLGTSPNGSFGTAARRVSTCFRRRADYLARDSFTHHGLEGLVPKKRGPRGRHKLTEKVVRFIKQARANDESLGGRRLAKLVQQHLRISIDARTIERGAPRREKKRP